MEFGFRCSEGNHNFPNALTEVRRAETLGFDSAWLSEHHGLRSHWPSPHVALAGLATATETIRLGTSVIILPEANPVRLTGELNLLDTIADGRFTLGVGVGWRESEMENLGWDFGTRGSRMTDSLRAMNALWESDIATYDGRHFQFQDVEIQPKPIQRPSPPVWVGGGSEQALKRAAYLGDAWFPNWLPSIDELEDYYERYTHFLREAGTEDDATERPILRFIELNDDRDEALRNLRTLCETIVDKYRDRGAPLESMERGLEGDFEEYAEGRFVFGPPSECLEKLDEYENRLGTTHMVFKTYNPNTGHDQVMNDIEAIAADILDSR